MRKTFIFTTAILTMLSQAAMAETIRATVNGMVCAFCMTGIEKTFKAQPAVKDVKVDMDTQLVTIYTKQGETLDDKTVNSLISDAGYSVTDIKRGDK